MRRGKSLFLALSLLGFFLLCILLCFSMYVLFSRINAQSLLRFLLS